ncbi:hypothetical protein C1645_738438 [Glomus cerebriforme]|uniref:Uncharacterized protein n=1 Tax=Glomus cerebriforme TaxID=658196 RepID=A0A397T3Q6_9GLOM|nr:hypothetical protein C1645_738438 [Glomus cerebriforme]
MVTDQKHSSDSMPTEQEVIRYTEKLTQMFGLNKQNTGVYKALFEQILALEKRLEDYHFEYVKLKRKYTVIDTWAKKMDLEWTKRKTLFNFSTMLLVQGKNTIKEFYSKLEECNKNFGHNEEFLKCALLKGLLSKNEIKILMGGLQALALDEIVKRLSPEQ